MLVIGSLAFIYISFLHDSNEPAEYTLLQAPDFSLPDASGKNISLETLEGDVKVITFWASWSPYTREELTSLSKLKEEYGDKVSVAALNRDANPAEGRAYLETLGLGEVLVFAYDQQDEYFKKVNGYAMPETLFLNADAKIVFHQHGPMTYDEMRAQIETMLR
ncbi:MAG: Thiol-disulfide isomerase and thioredoxin [Parcubacteria group bacterium GW2011_GWD2_42_14]|nr:MAG: Thiol-disulfide isomerase and thioredoxin [Parcubacteria group bacterium GW2011_GWD2_42_14]